MSNQREIFAIGVMSGTSLDGMDIAYCKFKVEHNKYTFDIIKAKTFNYSKDWIKKLTAAPSLSGENLSLLNVHFGQLIANNVNSFIQQHKLTPDFIASHGHTVFHQPKDGFTLQIGSGAEIAVITKVKTVCDFRTNDIALKGQGAPLVPIGDKLLFQKFDSCVNLGGFANISFANKNSRIAYDICPVNIAINRYSNMLSKEFDKGGEIAKNNKVNKTLLAELNSLPYYNRNFPKSLGREWFETIFSQTVEKFNIPCEDKIATITEHAAFQIGNSIKGKESLITGGGTFNQHLIDRIKQYTTSSITISNNTIINFKEALIFALLGLLRINNEINTLKSATGATRDNIGGCIYLP